MHLDSALNLAGLLSSFQLKVSIGSLTGPGCVRDGASDWNQARVVDMPLLAWSFASISLCKMMGRNTQRQW